jgi:hypothetical protein
MGIKSRYREKPAAEIPTDDKINAQLLEDYKNPGKRRLNEPALAPVEPPAEPSVEPAGDDTSDNEAVAQAVQQQAEADNAKHTLLRQLEAVRQAEQMQAQQFSRLKPPTTRQEWVAAMMQQTGVTQAEAEFLIDRPQMLQNRKALGKAMRDLTAAGVRRDDSPEYFEAVEDAFNRHLGRKQRKAAAKAEPVPEFFQPPTPLAPEPQPVNIYSAPVSR